MIMPYVLSCLHNFNLSLGTENTTNSKNTDNTYNTDNTEDHMGMNDENNLKLGDMPVSLWIDTTRDTGYTSLEDDADVDVAIVGAGITGLRPLTCCAAAAQDRGDRCKPHRKRCLGAYDSQDNVPTCS